MRRDRVELTALLPSVLSSSSLPADAHHRNHRYLQRLPTSKLSSDPYLDCFLISSGQAESLVATLEIPPTFIAQAHRLGLEIERGLKNRSMWSWAPRDSEFGGLQRLVVLLQGRRSPFYAQTLRIRALLSSTLSANITACRVDQRRIRRYRVLGSRELMQKCSSVSRPSVASFSSLHEEFTLELPCDVRRSSSTPQCQVVRYCSKGPSFVGSLEPPKVDPSFPFLTSQSTKDLTGKRSKLLCIKRMWLEIS